MHKNKKSVGAKKTRYAVLSEEPDKAVKAPERKQQKMLNINFLRSNSQQNAEHGAARQIFTQLSNTMLDKVGQKMYYIR